MCTFSICGYFGEIFYKSNGRLFVCLHILILTLREMGEFSKVLQTINCVSGFFSSNPSRVYSLIYIRGHHFLKISFHHFINDGSVILQSFTGHNYFRWLKVRLESKTAFYDAREVLDHSLLTAEYDLKDYWSERKYFSQFYYMAVSHKDWELPNSRIWLAEIDIDRGLDFPI